MNDKYYIDLFVDYMVSSRCASPNTSSSYRSDLRDLARFLQENELGLICAHADDLSKYIRSLGDQGYSPATIARKISAIRRFYGFLYVDRAISYDPSIPLDSCRLRRPLPRTLTTEEIDKLLDVAKLDVSVEGRRIAAIVNILYSSGVRISELVNLGFYEIESVLRERDSDIGHIIIKGKSGRERLVLLNSVAMESIKAYLEVRKCFIARQGSESKWLFPGKMFDHCLSRQRVWQLLKLLAISAGIDPNRTSPHKFRHSFATHLLNNGSNVVFIQKMLGHASLSTTQVYTHVAGDNLKKTLQEFHPLSKSTSQ